MTTSSQSSSRFHFIDLLRGWAVFIMIETHVVNALLRPDLKELSIYKALTFINGLVAPSFLLCAGFALAIVLHRKWADFTAAKPPMWRYVVRILFILVVAYSLHVPFFSFSRMRTVEDEQLWMSFFQVDILQTIAVTLLLLVLLALVVRRERYYVPVAGLMLVVTVFAAPIIREMDLSTLPIWLRPYLTMKFKSQFPLLPWSGFLIAGTMMGYFFQRAREKSVELRLVRSLTFLALTGILLSLVIELSPISLYPQHDFWRASPEFFFVRLGLIVLAGLFLWRYEQRHKISGRSVFTQFGQESLLVYVVHLLIVYGYTYELSFVRYFGPRLNFGECFGLFFVLTVAMYAMAAVWHWLKDWNIQGAKVIQFVTLAAIVVMFFLKET